MAQRQRQDGEGRRRSPLWLITALAALLSVVAPAALLAQEQEQAKPVEEAKPAEEPKPAEEAKPAAAPGAAEPAKEQAGRDQKRVDSVPASAALDLAQIERSIDRAIKALYKLEPEYTFRDDHSLRGASRGSRHYQETVHEVGNQALAVWALLAAGETYQNPPLFKRLNWVLSADPPFPYDRGMRAQMLAELPSSRWAPWVKRDFIWLKNALTTQGNFTYTWQGTKLDEWGDHANGQYGVLGLWGCERAGWTDREMPRIWKAIDEHWRKTQLPDGGWSVNDPTDTKQLAFFRRSSGPMTAGGVSTLTLTERFLKGQQLVEPGDNMSPELRKGLSWLDQNFKINDPAEENDWFFYMWTVQRVGHATGWRSFNGVDWFREVTAEMLRRQRDDGTWIGPQGVLLSTGFALLYLSRSYDPLAISKIRFSSVGDSPHAWNNRPHDIWNFVDYLSDQVEYRVTWQVVELDLPPYSLIETPILYLSTDSSFRFNDKQVDNLRGYIDNGGMLVTNVDSAKGEAGRSIADLITKLYPNRERVAVPKEHPLYTMHQQVPPKINMDMVHNGVRPLVIHFKTDIARPLQVNDLRGNTDAFVALSNVYLYATGMNPRRTRLQNNYVVQTNTRPNGAVIKAARIQHSGNFDPEPHALPQMAAIMANEYNLDLQIETVTPGQLGEHKVAFLTTTGDTPLKPEEAEAIGNWLKKGGTLWLDATTGQIEAAKLAEEMSQQIVPSTPALILDRTHPIITGDGLPGGFDNSRVRYRLYSLHRNFAVNRPRLMTLEIDGRPALIYSPEDLTCGWAGLDHWNIFGYSTESARKLLVNGLLSIAYPPRNRPQPVAQPAVQQPATPEPADVTPAAG